jgi:hypothetical protein
MSKKEVKKMASQLVKRQLEPKDEVQKSWSCSYNGKGGLLFLSKKKLIFVEEKGFLRKTYTMTVTISYEEIDTINSTNHFKLEINRVHGDQYNFHFDLPLSARADAAINEFKHTT